MPRTAGSPFELKYVSQANSSLLTLSVSAPGSPKSGRALDRSLPKSDLSLNELWTSISDGLVKNSLIADSPSSAFVNKNESGLVIIFAASVSSSRNQIRAVSSQFRLQPLAFSIDWNSFTNEGIYQQGRSVGVCQQRYRVLFHTNFFAFLVRNTIRSRSRPILGVIKEGLKIIPLRIYMRLIVGSWLLDEGWETPNSKSEIQACLNGFPLRIRF